jgi:two-component system cell cycle sensor histidine kinase/response regulator CckA
VASKTSFAAIAELDRLPVAGLVFELDGTVVAINDVAVRLFGVSDDVVGHKAWDLVPAMQDAWDGLVAGARERGSSSTSLTFDTRAIDLTSTLRDIGREVVFGIAIDVTHHKLAGEAQARADLDSKQRLESLGLVAGGIAHDFNNQLVSVLAEASAAREDDTLSPQTSEALRRIEASAKRMAQLTRQLLAYAGRGRFVTELTDPDELLRQTREHQSQLIDKGATVLDVKGGAGVIAIEADRGLLRQVITNLVSNASDALPAGGGNIRVISTLVTHAGKLWWQLEVNDDGAGMEPKTLARIFDPFFTTKPDHHGLGLSAVHGIVRRLGGDIDVDSQVGKGTRVRVRLPVVPGAEAKRKRSTSKQRQSGLHGMKVLVADDEPSVLATVRRLLERRGAIVVTANNGNDAEERMREDDYGLLLFDVMMPGQGGYDLIPLARVLQAGVPVMLMSGYTERTRANSSDEPDLFLEKPFTTKTLDKAIEDLLKDQP